VSFISVHEVYRSGLLAIRPGKIYVGQFVSHEGRIWLMLFDDTGKWDAYDPNDFSPVW